jgi:hypothetical protein
MANMNEIISVSGAGYSRPNRFWVLIPPPRIFLNQSSGRVEQKDLRQILLNCNNAVFPSKIMGTSEHRIKGSLRKMPYDIIYNDFTFSFYNDDAFSERAFFESWMKGMYKEGDNGYGFEYYENYITNITVAQLNIQNRAIRKTTIFEAFPINISEIGLGYENNDAVEVFTVTFAYKHFESVSIKEPYQGIPGSIEEPSGILGNLGILPIAAATKIT